MVPMFFELPAVFGYPVIAMATTLTCATLIVYMIFPSVLIQAYMRYSTVLKQTCEIIQNNTRAIEFQSISTMSTNLKISIMFLFFCLDSFIVVNFIVLSIVSKYYWC